MMLRTLMETARGADDLPIDRPASEALRTYGARLLILLMATLAIGLLAAVFSNPAAAIPVSLIAIVLLLALNLRAGRMSQRRTLRPSSLGGNRQPDYSTGGFVFGTPTPSGRRNIQDAQLELIAQKMDELTQLLKEFLSERGEGDEHD